MNTSDALHLFNGCRIITTFQPPLVYLFPIFGLVRNTLSVVMNVHSNICNSVGIPLVTCVQIDADPMHIQGVRE